MAPAPKYSTDEQEKMILLAAEQTIDETSLLDFSMSSIAKKSNLSMGSVYKFVQCKEDLLIALATKMFEARLHVFRHVLSLPLTTPERILAISLVDFSKVQMFNFETELEFIVKTPAIMKRSSRRWLDHMMNSSKVCESAFNSFLHAAVESGELISGSKDIEDINIGTWSLTVGYFQIVRLHESWNNEQGFEKVENLAALSLDNAHIRNLKRLINSYDWQQKLTNEDMNKICQHLTNEGLR